MSSFSPSYNLSFVELFGRTETPSSDPSVSFLPIYLPLWRITGIWFSTITSHPSLSPSLSHLVTLILARHFILQPYITFAWKPPQSVFSSHPPILLISVPILLFIFPSSLPSPLLFIVSSSTPSFCILPESLSQEIRTHSFLFFFSNSYH